MESEIRDAFGEDKDKTRLAQMRTRKWMENAF
jgi:hypothetical protein